MKHVTMYPIQEGRAFCMATENVIDFHPSMDLSSLCQECLEHSLLEAELCGIEGMPPYTQEAIDEIRNGVVRRSND